jgi:hypothetical protein
MNKQNHMDAKKRLKLGTCYCPVCEKPRQKGNHAQCSRITQLKGMTERREINENNGRIRPSRTRYEDAEV